MSIIYKLFKKPMNLEDVADLLHKQGTENIQILCEVGTFYEPFINIDKAGERRKRFYINEDVTKILSPNRTLRTRMLLRRDISKKIIKYCLSPLTIR